jgi:hypothetical protein
MGVGHQPATHTMGAVFGRRVRGPGKGKTPGRGIFTSSLPQHEEYIMNKWKIIKDSAITKVAVSGGTLIAVAATVGAGWKWN